LTNTMPEQEIEGQLNAREREILTQAVLEESKKPKVVLEVGTWLGGGSTTTFLKALHRNGEGRLWGIEADKSIYDRMIENIRKAAPEALSRFTPLFGFSQQVIPQWLGEQAPGFQIDIAFLDGGNNPMEQITEFELVAPRIPVGGQLMGHDAKLRKGKWLVPYVSAHDNWECAVHDISDEGLFYARKTKAEPSPESRRQAKSILFKMRCQPVELLGVLLPHGLRKLIFKIMPPGFSRRVADGRKG